MFLNGHKRKRPAEGPLDPCLATSQAKLVSQSCNSQPTPVFELEKELEQNGENLSPGTTARFLKSTQSSQEEICSTPGAVSGVLCGKLQKLVLKNFMNHRHLEVPFGDKINFVTGKNGSGKSAIVTALLIGLGAKASFTQRAASTKGLIRKDESAATVAIHLSNEGKNPFQRETYGPTIVIERRITQSASTYKIKTHRDRTIGTTATLMHRVLDHFDICIDNPTTILTQDMSREFLATAEPTKMYSFFKQVTRLDLLEDDLKEIKANVEKGQKVVERTKEKLAHFLEQIKKIQVRIKACDSKEQLQLKRRRLQVELLVVMKKDLDAKKFELQRRVTDKERNIEMRRQKIADSQREVDKIETERQKVQTEIDDLNKQTHLLNEEKSNKESIYREANRTSSTVKMSIQSKESSIRNLKKELAAMEKVILQHRARNENEYAQESRKLQEKLAELEKEIEESKSEAQSADAKLKQVNDNEDRLRQDLRMYRHQIAMHESDIKQMETRVRQLKESKDNHLKLYGLHVPELLEAIKTEARFSKTPKGPLGRYIKASKAEYEIPIEQCIGSGLMTGFMCDNRSDAAILRGIFERVIGRDRKQTFPQLIVQSFMNTIYDTSGHKSQTNSQPTLQEVINCEDPVVMNCLIDQVSPENILIFNSLKEARQVLIMSDPPAKTEKGICLNGSEVIPGRAVYANNVKECNFFQRDDISHKIATTQEQIETIKRDKAAAEIEIRSLDEKFKSNKEVQKSLLETKFSRERKFESASRLAKEVKRDLDQLLSDETTEVYESEIRDDASKLEKEEASLVQIKNTLEKLKLEEESAKSEFHSLQEKYNCLRNELRSKTNRVQNLNVQLSEHVETKKFYLTSIAPIEREIQDNKAACTNLDTQISNLQQKIDEQVLDQEEYGRMMRSRRSKADIEKALVDSRNLLAAKEKENPENRADLEAQLAIQTDKYSLAESEISEREELLAVLQDALKFRQTKFLSLRENATVTMANGFAHRLGLRGNGYSGKLVFDHEAKTLDILIKTKSDKVLKNKSQLSGGERSFTTVCFITAMWSAVSGTSPFKVRKKTNSSQRVN